MIFLAIPVVLAIGSIYLYSIYRKSTLTSPVTQSKITKEAAPSEVLTVYSDPSGFTFSYPDNLSIEKKEIEDDSVYTDLQLSSKDVSGSLSLKIADSKFVSLKDWVKENTTSAVTPKELKMGSLTAEEIKLPDRVLLGALDQGILFTVEMPAVEEKFWGKVYDKVLSSFSFVAPETVSSGDTAPDDVSFEGEEVVE